MAISYHMAEIGTEVRNLVHSDYLKVDNKHCSNLRIDRPDIKDEKRHTKLKFNRMPCQ